MQFLGDLFDFWQMARQEPVEPTAAAQTATLRRRGVALEVDGVHFAYPTSTEPVLRDVSLRIKAGERAAIVGENGAGKTTLAKLLLDLYQPDDGVIRFDGAQLTPERAVAIRRRVAAVFQYCCRYELTLRKSIGFGGTDLSGGQW